MKTAISLVLGVLFSVSAFSNPANPPFWRQGLTLNYEEANTPQEVKKLMKKYPQYFASLQNAKVTSAFVGAWTAEYVGPTKCSFDDPRLVQTAKSFGAHYVENGKTEYVQHNSLWPYDPCLE